MPAYYLAIDIVSSSGRHILGYVEDGRIVLEEIHRFDNRQIHRNGHDCLDLDNLWTGIVDGPRSCSGRAAPGLSPISLRWPEARRTSPPS